RQRAERVCVVIRRADDLTGDGSGRIGGGIEEREREAERLAGEPEHAAELTAAEDADPHVERRRVARARFTFGALRGSGLARTVIVWWRRNRLSAARIFGWPFATIAAARSAALVAPAAPTASVPTGIPAGIWTIESSESSPW